MLSGSPEAMERFKAPTMREFNQKVIPGIAERFSGVVGGQRSSGFQNAIAEAAAMLSENLSAQKENLKQGAVGQALNYSQMPMLEQQNLRSMALGQSGQTLSADPYMQAYYPKPFQPYQQDQGFLHGLVGNVAPVAGTAIGTYFGGPLGGAIGGALGGGMAGKSGAQSSKGFEDIFSNLFQKSQPVKKVGIENFSAL